MIYLNVEYVSMVHEKILELSGGKSGFSQDPINIEKIEFMKNDVYYPDIEHKLSYLVYSINKNHIFEDGNKRTSIGVGAGFLVLNGYKAGIVDKFIEEMENIAVGVAAGTVSRDLLLAIITSLLNEPQYSVELKVNIYNAIGQLNTEITSVNYNEII